MKKCVSMYVLLVCLPLLGFLLCASFGRAFGVKGTPLVATLCVGVSGVLSVCCLYEVGLCGSPCYIHCAPWFHSSVA